MKSIDTLQDRITKAQEFITKKESTISKKSVRSEKLQSKLYAEYRLTWNGKILTDKELQDLGFDRDMRWEILNIEWDIDTLESDVKNLQRQLVDKQEKLQEYQSELAEVLDIHNKLEKEVPEAFKQARQELVNSWTEYDINRRNQCMQDRKDMEYKDWKLKWKYSEYLNLQHTDEEFLKINEREADSWLLDLYNRVKEFTGTVTDAHDVRFSGKALNGWILGEKGNCCVETILAGGYNIQRLHMRVLVHKYIK